MNKYDKNIIDQFPAGNILNDIIAREVMGWSADPEGYWLDPKDGYADTGWGDMDQEKTKNHPACRKFDPSNDITAAREVLKKLEKDGWYWTIANHAIPLRSYECSLSRPGGGNYCKAETLELAICRAAWAVVQEPVN